MTLPDTVAFTKRSVLGQGVYGYIYKTGRGPAAPVVKTFFEVYVTELRLLLKVRHPHLCPGLGLVRVHVTGLAPVGVLLPRYECDLHNYATRMTWEAAPVLMGHVMEAVTFLHERMRVLHLDVASTNIFIAPGPAAILGDFGLAVTLPPGAEAIFSPTRRCSEAPPEAGPRPRPTGMCAIGFLSLDAAEGGHAPADGFVYSRASDLYGVGKAFEAGAYYLTARTDNRSHQVFSRNVRRLLSADPSQRPRVLETVGAAETCASSSTCLGDHTKAAAGAATQDVVTKEMACYDSSVLSRAGSYTLFFRFVTPRAHRVFAAHACSVLTMIAQRRPDMPLTLVLVLVDILNRVAAVERVAYFPSAILLAIQYTCSEALSFEWIGGATQEHVGKLVWLTGGIVFDSARNVTHPDSRETIAALHSLYASVINGRTLEYFDNDENRTMPFYDHKMCEIICSG